MTEIILYQQMSTCSRRAICRARSRFGMPYTYTPRGTLLKRLAKQNGMTIEQVYNQLQKERQVLLRLRGPIQK